MTENEIVPAEVQAMTETPVPTPLTESAALMTVIARAATDPNIDIDKMERLMVMHQDIVNKQAENEFYTALAKMQPDLPVVEKNGQIVVKGEVRSDYAKFEDMNEVIKPILKKNGFAITFRVEFEGQGADRMVITTAILSHKKGHKETNSVILPADHSGSKNAVQAIGSTISYGKRYAMETLLNITTKGVDDDGNGDNLPEKLSPEQVAEVTEALKGIPVEKVGPWLKSVFMADRLEDIQADMYNQLITSVKKRAADYKKRQTEAKNDNS